VPFDLTRTVEPDTEPVSLAIAKSHLRVIGSADDEYIRELLAGARDAAERESGRQLVTATFALTLDDFPRGGEADGWSSEIRLPVGPVIAVDSVVYRDDAGDTQTLATSEYSAGVKTGRVSPVTYWPATDADQLENVTVTFRAGYGGAAQVPPAARAAVLLILADRYENRGDNVANFLADRPIPAAALRLLRSLGDGHQW
jgi:uncharacterized phiE125 gp8 family phage protein